jgi:hypothetical protein
MPQLIQGHVHFTEDDFLMTDYHELAAEQANKTSYAKLAAVLHSNGEQLAFMKDPVILDYFDTTENIKKILTHSLSVIASLAHKEGYTLAELMR